MPSGYDKSPDYGGGDPGPWELPIMIALFVVIIVAMAWWRFG